MVDKNRVESIYISNLYFIEMIYSMSKLANCPITFTDTITILRGYSVDNYLLKHIKIIDNLKITYQYMIETLYNPIDIEYIKKIDSLIMSSISNNKSVIRTDEFNNQYNYPTIKEEDINRLIKEVLIKSNDMQTQAVDIFLLLCRIHCFWGGNKRTAAIIANKILISNNVGILLIVNVKEFLDLLDRYLLTDDDTVIKSYLHNVIIRIE